MDRLAGSWMVHQSWLSVWQFWQNYLTIVVALLGRPLHPKLKQKKTILTEIIEDYPTVGNNCIFQNSDGSIVFGYKSNPPYFLYSWCLELGMGKAKHQCFVHQSLTNLDLSLVFIFNIFVFKHIYQEHHLFNIWKQIILYINQSKGAYVWRISIAKLNLYHVSLFILFCSCK